MILILVLLMIFKQKKNEKILKKSYLNLISELLKEHPECIREEKVKESKNG